jgi:hypothetical protein
MFAKVPGINTTLIYKEKIYGKNPERQQDSR